MEGSCDIRLKIFNWMLKARANSTFHIGFPDPQNNGAMRFSHYLGIDSHHAPHSLNYQQQQQQSQPQPTQQPQQGQQQTTTLQQQTSVQEKPEPIPAATLSTISIRRGCKRITECLQVEKGLSSKKQN